MTTSPGRASRRVTVLSGGVGGARFLQGLLTVPGWGEDVTVVATGSLAPLVVGEAGSIDVHEPWLTLIGLRLIYQKNTSQ